MFSFSSLKVLYVLLKVCNPFCVNFYMTGEFSFFQIKFHLLCPLISSCSNTIYWEGCVPSVTLLLPLLTAGDRALCGSISSSSELCVYGSSRGSRRNSCSCIISFEMLDWFFPLFFLFEIIFNSQIPLILYINFRIILSMKYL